ncbi:Ig-like domain-containing protein [Microbulbifer pacificus]|uniref:Ig-like domain-containing protein n=1 Tax=Microbulbifer pacificus TaxID=407164 RepID=UPI000CF52731|nr:Ig-like domain-containing protein [Microbulbifer pacificus]
MSTDRTSLSCPFYTWLVVALLLSLALTSRGVHAAESDLTVTPANSTTGMLTIKTKAYTGGCNGGGCVSSWTSLTVTHDGKSKGSLASLGKYLGNNTYSLEVSEVGTWGFRYEVHRRYGREPYPCNGVPYSLPGAEASVQTSTFGRTCFAYFETTSSTIDYDSVEVANPISKPEFTNLPTENDAADGKYALNWTRPSGVKRFELQEKQNSGAYKAVRLSSPTASSYQPDEKPQGNTYYYRLQACNDLECSGWTSAVAVKVRTNEAPKVTWEEPPSGSYRPDQLPTLYVEATDLDGIKSVQFYRNDGKKGSKGYSLGEVKLDAAKCAGCYRVNWTSSPLSSSIKIWAEATDNLGAKKASSDIFVSVQENKSPTGWLVSPPTSIKQFDSVTLTAQAQDADGSVKSVEFLLDNSRLGIDTKAPYQQSWTPAHGGSFQLKVRVTDNEGSSKLSNAFPVTVAALKPPAAPSQLMIDNKLQPIPANTSGQFALSWNSMANTDYYELEWLRVGKDTKFQPLSLANNKVPGHSLFNLEERRYRFRAYACNRSGCSAPSAEIALDVVKKTPVAPSTLTAEPDTAWKTLFPQGYSALTEAFSGRFVLRWGTVSGGPVSPTYRLQEKPGFPEVPGTWKTIKTTSESTYFSTAHKSPGTYSYRVLACNPAGCSQPGAITSVSVFAPALSAGALECNGTCVRLQGWAIDPAAKITLTAVHHPGTQQTFPASALQWASMLDVSVPIVKNSALYKALFELGVRATVENPNGARGSLIVYGDRATEIVGESLSGPALGPDGTLYVGADDKLFALDTTDGSVKPAWPFTLRSGGLIKATPRVDGLDGTVYVGSLDHSLYAITPHAIQKWRLETGGKIVSPAVVDEQRILYVGAMDGVLYAANAESGRLKWTFPAGAGIAEAPVLAGEDHLYFTTIGSSQVYALSRGTDGPGKLVWESVDDELWEDIRNRQPAPSEKAEFLSIARLFRGLLQPPLPFSERILTFWTYQLLSGHTNLLQVTEAFLASETGRDNFPAGLSDQQFVDVLYARLFPNQNHPPITFGSVTYTREQLIQRLAEGHARAQIALLMTQSQEYTQATSTLLSHSFDYLYQQDFEWAVTACNTGDAYTRDCDEDGLPDWWEILFLGNTDSGPKDDPDGDGLTNEEAFWSKVSPCATGCSGGIADTPPPPAPAPTLDPAEVQASAELGALAGSFRVDERGGISYTVPISVPAGTAGVAPELALSYSSHSGNGIAGQGWSLSGLSAIGRCRQTLSQDGQAAPITWSAEDRFCLDGQRLLVVDGDYGAPGSQYRTEIDQYLLVTARGGSAGHPDYFTVERKDGSISYYGRGNQSQQTVADGRVFTWAINRYEDSAGNGIAFHYRNDRDGHRIASIGYAFGATTTPGATVEFEYATRPDPMHGYLAGWPLANTQRLTTVTVRGSQGEALRHYQLHYLARQWDTLSRLASIEECAGGLCRPATTFDWRLPSTEFRFELQQTLPLAERNELIGQQTADINGDGRQDLVWMETRITSHPKEPIRHQSIRYRLAEADGFGEERTVFDDGDNRDKNDFYKWHMADVNGDGRSDLLVFRNGRWERYQSQPDPSGDGWVLSTLWGDLGLTDEEARFFDINGDGLVDYVTPHQYRLLEPKGDPAAASYYQFGKSYAIRLVYTPGNVPTGWSGRDDSNLQPADLNGDGQVDLIFGSGSGQTAFVSTGTPGEYQFYHYWSSNQDRKVPMDLMDLNSDGLPDALYRNKNSEEGYYQLNTGNGFGERHALGKIGERRLYADLKGDGQLALIWRDEGRLNMRLWQPDKQRFTAPQLLLTGGDKDSTDLFADIDGDGVREYLRFDDRDLRWHRPRGWDLPHNVIDGIENGLGARTDVTYGGMLDSGHYAHLALTQNGEAACRQNAARAQSQSAHRERWCTQYLTADYRDFFRQRNRDWSEPQSLGKLSPVLEQIGGQFLVTRVESSAPAANDTPGMVDTTGKSAVSYFYGQAQLQAAGRGHLGFHRIRTVDEQTGVETTTRYRQDFPYIGRPAHTEVRTAQGHLLSEADNTWQLYGWQDDWPAQAKHGTTALGPLKPYLAESVEKVYALRNDGQAAGELLKTVTTSTEQDAHGNATRITVTTQAANGDTFSTDTLNQYHSKRINFENPEHNFTGYRELGRLYYTRVTHSRTEGGQSSTAIRSNHFYYHLSGNEAGLLRQKSVDRDLPWGRGLRSFTNNSYDRFGNKVYTYYAPEAAKSRTSRWYYDDRGRFVEREENTFGQTTRKVLSRNAYGQPTRVQDMAGVETAYTYDAFGRQILEHSATGAHNVSLFAQASVQCPAGSAYQHTERSSGGAEQITCFDALARSVRQLNRAFDGSWNIVDTEYDALGRVKHQSQPYQTGGTRYWSTQYYDRTGRVIGTDLPGIQGSNGTPYDTAIDYDGLTTVTTNPKGQVHRETVNVLGEKIQVQDNLGNVQQFQHDAQGKLTKVINKGDGSRHLETVMVYDLRGRKAEMSDPDKGTWRYIYNGADELTEQTDARGQKVENTYDLLGRLQRRIDYRPDGSLEADTRWHYNNDTTWQNGVPPGALARVEETQSGYLKVHTYDSLGRPSETATSFGAGDDHFEKTNYDQYGRPFQVFDAGGDGSWESSAIQHRYNAYGYLAAVSDAEQVNLAPGETYYTVLAMDARGNVTQSVSGNGVTTEKVYDPATGRLQQQTAHVLGLTNIQDQRYQWDSLGNLEHRIDRSGDKNLREDFEYDGLNRLTRSQVQGRAAQTVHYNDLGNITHKSDVGDYRYGSDCVASQNAGPHAVCATEDASGHTVAYHYDANGNMTRDGTGRSFKYSTFDKPTEIKQSGHTTQFKYGPDRARYLRIDIDAQGKRTETRTIGNVEKISGTDGTTEIKRYLPGGALITVSNSGKQRRYLHKDHLGSIDVITDGSGTVEQALSFDAWGQRRNALEWSALLHSERTNFDTRITTRGYTGHEMLDQSGLIHMNGRIYDPKLARFLQADPYLQAPDYSQSHNRYAYVWNNPLNATDPSGYFRLREWVGVIVAVAGAYICGPGCSKLGYTLVGAASGASGAAANGGNIAEGALWGGVSAAAFAGIGSHLSSNYGGTFAGGLNATGYALKIGAHALTGGVMAELQGGKFGHGFAAAGFTAAGTSFNNSNHIGGAGYSVTRVIVAAVIGGTASKLSGGKFANGAATAAFAMAMSSIGRNDVQDVHSTNGDSASAENIAAFQEELDALAADRTLNPYKAFDSADAAATEVLDVTAPLSEKYGLEVGGNIWKSKNGWRYTMPKIGGPGSVSVSTTHIGYHTHPSGDLMFSNRSNNFSGSFVGGDSSWVAKANKPLYLGVQHGGAVRIGICNPGNCSHVGRLGTPPSRVVQ